MIIKENDYLIHYGILRKSGRYPWGSGNTQSARNRSFLDTIKAEQKQGMTDSEIATGHGMSISDLRALKSIAVNQLKAERVATAQKLHEKGMSNVEIAKQMGLNESTVRNLRKPGAEERADRLRSTANMLRDQVEEKGYIDVGAHVENHLRISRTQLTTAIAILREESDYKLHYLKMPQPGTGKFTTLIVLSKPDIPYKEIYANKYNIRQITEHTEDGGHGWLGNQPPIQVDSKRIGINYKEDGGAKADGVIYVRPNVDDLTLGGSQYSQVRIAVDGTHYLKGMAVYKDNLPEGVDLVFNTNKSNTGDKHDAMKPLKRTKDGDIDKDNPFGADFIQLPKYNEDGTVIKNSVRSAMNLVNTEGDWDKWSKSLSTQFLSKQSTSLAREQLNMTRERKRNELNEILSLTNPVVKQKLLESFADDADSSAVHLKAMHLPRQRAQVIMPINSLKENEVYAPNFLPGERVILVRHPHGGKFELPELVVNNSNREGIKLLGKTATDAIGINHKVAERLSGADFDGDTVLVIPNNSGRIGTESPLHGLKNFNPQELYKPYDGMRTIDGGVYHAATKSVDYGGRSPSGATKQNQMGSISNLITDMTIHGATHTELAAAVRHSMVVIDAEKHNLDYRRSARENGISALAKKYQVKPGGRSGGSSTIISRAKSPVSIPERKLRLVGQGGPIDPKTGKKMYVNTGVTYVHPKTGVLTERKTKLKALELVDDAHQLSSGTKIEEIYADHSNSLKAMANEARKEMVSIKSPLMSKSAKAAYAPQVQSLKAKLDIAEKNAPRERQAIIIANHTVAMKKAQYPDMEKADLKKINGQALAAARVRTGAKKQRIDITPDEWNAIQAGAISASQIRTILNNTDLDQVKKLATPRTPTVMTDVMQSRAKTMLASGYSQGEVAAALGVPLSTLKSSVIAGD